MSEHDAEDRRLASVVIDEDIRAASTLPGWLYSDAAFHARVRERVFARSWQPLDPTLAPTRGRARPFTLLPGCLDEPLVLSCEDDGRAHCFSNVCTHRANVVVEREGPASGLRCRYHGRRFGADGRFVSMPEFEDVRGFPSAADDLPRARLERWGPLSFTAIAPAFAFETWIAPVRERVGWIDLDRAVLDPSRTRDYVVRASWALYCDNYLEGFHVPFVHRGLASQIDYGSYRTELFELGTLQTGFAADGEDAFEPPAGHVDHGRRPAAYWFWLFPNLMLNFYPWGLSVNVVVPLDAETTRVSYSAWVTDSARLDRGAGADLERVEREDEEVVEAVQRGVRSRLYGRGRYSPTRETGVHHFHRLLVRSAG